MNTPCPTRSEKPSTSSALREAERLLQRYSASLSPQQRALLRAEYLEDKTQLPSDPLAFAQQAEPGLWERWDHLEVLCDALLRVAQGRLRRLMVNMPPRHGKSETTSHWFPAWYLGTYPDRRVILTSYEADFAASWGRKARGELEEWGPKVFGVTVNPRSKAANRWELLGHHGGMVTAGVGGPITGRGANVLVIDDPVKNALEASSPLTQVRNWEWYQGVARTRLEPGGSIVLVMTRWNESDLAGMILQDAREKGREGEWEVIKLQAISKKRTTYLLSSGREVVREAGEALCPERYDLKALKDIRQDVGDYYWDAEYQQEPQPPLGGYFFRDWDPAVHVRSEGELRRLFGTESQEELFPPWWPSLGGHDYGYGHAQVFLWARVGPDGVVYVYDELWLRHTSVEEFCERVWDKGGRPPSLVGSGPDTFTLARETKGGPAIDELMAAAKYPVPVTNPTKGLKAHHQWTQVRRYLRWKDSEGNPLPGRPLLVVVKDRCPNLVAQMPAQLTDPDDQEKKLKMDIDPATGKGGDDAVDALAYLLMLRPYSGTAPKKSPPPGSIDFVLRNRRRAKAGKPPISFSEG
jgi:hypothetical protein